MELNELSLTAVADLISSRKVSARDVLGACLTRIDEHEENVGAFEYLDKDHAIQQASRLDDGPLSGPLHGLPMGIKDIIDTVDMPTAWGVPSTPAIGRLATRAAWRLCGALVR